MAEHRRQNNMAERTYPLVLVDEMHGYGGGTSTASQNEIQLGVLNGPFESPIVTRAISLLEDPTKSRIKLI